VETHTKQDAVQVYLGQGETLIVISENNKSHFLQVEVDEYDDIVFRKRQNLSKENGEKQ